MMNKWLRIVLITVVIIVVALGIVGVFHFLYKGAQPTNDSQRITNNSLSSNAPEQQTDASSTSCVIKGGSLGKFVPGNNLQCCPGLVAYNNVPGIFPGNTSRGICEPSSYEGDAQ